MNEATIQEELFAAICHNEADGVAKLLTDGAEVNEVFANNLTPLMVAARAGAHEVIPVLLSAGAEVNTQDCLWGRSAFHWLCCQGLTSHYHVEAHTESARALLAAGADAYQADYGEETPLLLALRRRLKNVIRLIHAYSPIPNGSGHRLLIPWLDINHIRRNNPSLAAYTDKQLHDYYIKPPAPRRPGTTPRNPVPSPYDAAWACSADLHATDRRGYTALHHAAAMGLYEVAAILLERGAEVDATSRSGATALILAARSGQHKVGHLLLAHGANPHHRDCYGRDAIDYARRAGNYRLFL
ncbi:MAG: ankyrin repeat domain-containing protein [Akkermansia sp.]|nr:ankyrin repeat domain-containing protein [Akkermansia sp.]